MANCYSEAVQKNQKASVLTSPASNSAELAKVTGRFDQVKENVEKKMEKCQHFSIRGYVTEMRQKDVKICLPFSNYNQLEPLDMPKCWLCERGIHDIVISGATTDPPKSGRACPNQLNGDSYNQLREHRALRETNTPGKEADKRSRKVIRVNKISAAVKNLIDTDDERETIKVRRMYELLREENNVRKGKKEVNETGDGHPSPTLQDNENLQLGDTRIGGFFIGESSAHSRLHGQDLLNGLNARITETTNILRQQQQQKQNSTTEGINLDLSLRLSSCSQAWASQPLEAAVLNPSSDEGIVVMALLSLNSGPQTVGPQDPEYLKGRSPLSGSQFQIPTKRAKSTGTAGTSGASASNVDPKSFKNLVGREVNESIRQLKESPVIDVCKNNRNTADFTAPGADSIYMIKGEHLKPMEEGSWKRRLDEN